MAEWPDFFVSRGGHSPAATVQRHTASLCLWLLPSQKLPASVFMFLEFVMGVTVITSRSGCVCLRVYRPNSSFFATVGRFICGFLAGTCAKLSTHPLDVAKKRFQIAGLARDARYGARFDVTSTQGLWQCIRQVRGASSSAQ